MIGLKRAAAIALLGLAPLAHAGLFDDDEARRAILDLRNRIDQSAEQSRKAQADQSAQLGEQISTLRSSLLDLNNQIELMRNDIRKWAKVTAGLKIQGE